MSSFEPIIAPPSAYYYVGMIIAFLVIIVCLWNIRKKDNS